MTSPVRIGADLALDRILQSPEEPPTLTPAPIPFGTAFRQRFRRSPEPTREPTEPTGVIPGVPRTPFPSRETLPSGIRGIVPERPSLELPALERARAEVIRRRTPEEVAAVEQEQSALQGFQEKGFDFTITSEGQDFDLKLKQTGIIEFQGQDVGFLNQEGEFEPFPQTKGQEILGGFFKGLDVVLGPFRKLGAILSGAPELETPENIQRREDYTRQRKELERRIFGKELTGPDDFSAASEEQRKQFNEERAVLRRSLGISFEEVLGRRFEAFEQLPWWEQLLFELPGYVLAGGLGPGAVRGALAPTAARGGIRGGLAQAVRVPLAPPAAVTKVLGEAVTLPLKGGVALTKKILSLPFRRTTELAKLGGDAAPAVRDRAGRLIDRVTRGKEGFTERDLNFIRRTDPQFAQKLETLIKDIRKSRLPEKLPEAKIELATNSIRTVLKSLDEAAKVVRETAALRKPVRGARFERGAAAAEGVTEKGIVGLRQEIAAFQRELVGELPASARIVQPQFPPEAIDALNYVTKNSAILTDIEKNNVRHALDILLTAQRWNPIKNNWDLGQLRKGEIELLRKTFGTELAELTPTLFKKSFRVALDILNLPRAIRASVDLSMIGRQGWMLGVSNPTEWAKAMTKGSRLLFTPKVKKLYKELDDVMRAEPEFAELESLGMDFSDIAGPLAKRAEPFMSSLSQKIPWIGRSQLAFTYSMNKMMFDVGRKELRRRASSEMPDMARLINYAAGRGPSIGSDELAGLLNTVFFATKFQTSKVALPMLILSPNTNPAIRKLAIRYAVQFVGANLSLLSLLAVHPGISVETDSRSSDFMKIKFGKTRIDPWAGWLPWYRLSHKIASQERKTALGQVVQTDIGDEIGRFVRSKLNIPPALVWNIISGKTFIGEDIGLDLESAPLLVRETFMPFFVDDFLDALAEEGLFGSMPGATAAFLGLGVGAYSPRQWVEWALALEEVTEKEHTLDELNRFRVMFDQDTQDWTDYWEQPNQSAKRNFLEENPETDASLYFWGERTKIETEEARDIVEAKLEELDLPPDMLPVRTMEPPYDESGKESEEIFWDFADILPKASGDWVIENRTTLDESQFPDLIRSAETLRFDDNRLMGRYDLESKGLEDAERVRLRQTNPEMDSALVFWRGYVPRSKEAFDLAKAKANSFGISEDVIKPFGRTIRRQTPKKLEFGTAFRGR